MLVLSHPAPMFATNCWVIATGPGQECIIVDPGMPDISHEVEALVADFNLKPVAALITHGHLDHTFSVKSLADGYDIASYIHVEDRLALAHPEKFHGTDFIKSLATLSFEEPKKVSELRHGDVLDFVGLKIAALHAPGHTRGSVMFSINDELLLSGDVLFAGAIGRTDLPTGSSEAMAKTLKTRILTLPDELRVLPGHGRETTIGHERKNNPYLREFM
jgi:hydroxyacylglutathione hydrolase